MVREMLFQPSPTTAQKRLVQKLQEKKISCLENIKIEGWEVDILIHPYHLAVEIDGFYHLSKTQKQRDEEKTRQLTAAGYHVVRFTNTEIYENCDSCVKKVEYLIHGHKTKVKDAAKVKSAEETWHKELRQILAELKEKEDVETNNRSPGPSVGKGRGRGKRGGEKGEAFGEKKEGG